MEDAKKMAGIACRALEGKKGEDIRLIEIGEVSVIADYFIIVNGNNVQHVQALVDSVELALGLAGYEPKAIEGIHNASWVLMDYRDVVIHIFSKEDRTFYDLERVWRDGKEIDPKEL